jgi:hypothetical protein
MAENTPRALAARYQARADNADTNGHINAASGLLTVRPASLERSQPPRWLWYQRVVIGYLNLLLGNEGIGKSTLIAWVIARVTCGELPGDLRGRPMGVGILGDEDSFDDVWTPRLHAAKADLTQVVQIERPDGGFVNIREDREKLQAVASEHNLGLLYFDQLLDNLGVGVDDWRQKAVRDALQPIRALSREIEISTLGSLHPNKRADSFRELMAGTVAFNSVSRSSLLLAQHPEDENLRVLVRGKGNLSQIPEAIEFQLDEHRFTANGHEFKVPLAQGFHVGDLTVDDLLGDEPKLREHSQVADACEIITALLPKDGEWHAAKPMYEACMEEGIEDRTVKRAKARLKLEHQRTQTFPATIEWRWPDTQDTDGSSEIAVPTVPTVPTTNGHKPLRGSSEDTQDTQDGENKGPQWVLSGKTPQPTFAPLSVDASEHSNGRVS